MVDLGAEAGDIRYRVAWVPPQGEPLGDFGRRWTGWCPDEGLRQPSLGSDRLRGDLRHAADGLGATGLIAPVGPAFRLSHRESRWGLEHALDDLCQNHEAARLPRLGLAVVGGRLVLVPEVPSTGVERIVAETMRVVAAMAAGGIGTGSYRFHLPLSDPIGTMAAERLKRRLGTRLVDILGRAQTVRGLSLLALGDRQRPARVIAQFALAPARRGRDHPALEVFGPVTETPPIAEQALGGAEMLDRREAGTGG